MTDSVIEAVTQTIAPFSSGYRQVSNCNLSDIYIHANLERDLKCLAFLESSGSNTWISSLYTSGRVSGEFRTEYRFKQILSE